MFKESNTVNIFPNPVWVHQLERPDAERLSRDLLAVLEREKARSQSYRPGQTWQSRNDLQSDEELTELCSYALAAADHALDQLAVAEREVKVTGCWFNLQPPGGAAHNSHIHPNNYLSGVYYLKTPAGGNAIIFHDPKPQTNIIMPRFAEPNAFNSRRATVSVQPGTLVLFPAWLGHSVPKSESAEERISISFNIMFKAFDEKLSAPRWEFL